MSKIYTSIISKKILFLASDIPEGTDLNNYVPISLTVQDQEVSVYCDVTRIVKFINSVNSLPKIQTVPWKINYQTIESQVDHVVLTGRLQDMYPKNWPQESYLNSEEFEGRIQIAREFGFEVIEQDI
jgi:hypothetical protein